MMNDEFRQNCEDLRLVIFHLNEIALSYAADAARYSLESSEWCATCEDYEGKIIALKDKIRTQESKVEHLANTQKILDATLENLARQRQELDAEKIALEDEYRQKNKTLDAEYHQKNENLDAEYRQKNNNWQIQKNAEQQDLERQRAEVEREKQTTLQIQQDAQNDKDAAAEIYANNKAKIDNYDNLYQEKIDAQNNLAAEKSRADSLQENLNAANSKIGELEKQIATLTEQMNAQPVNANENLAPENHEESQHDEQPQAWDDFN